MCLSMCTVYLLPLCLYFTYVVIRKGWFWFDTTEKLCKHWHCTFKSKSTSKSSQKLLKSSICKLIQEI